MPPPLTPERWRRLQQVFDEVVDSSPEGQRAAVDREAAVDPDLAAELAAMLAHEAAAAGRLRDVIGHGVDAAAAPP